MSSDNLVDLTNPSELKQFVKKHHLYPKKSLGQHWLINKTIITKIIQASLPASSFVEIGPGTGVLTQQLVKHAHTLAIDLDTRVGDALLESAPQATFLHQDILKTNILSVSQELEKPCVMVSNLPYSISTAVLSKMVEWQEIFSRFIFMMQKEVAEKVIAQAGNPERGSLSVALQARFHIEKICDVSPRAFIPPPKVYSRVLLLVPNDIKVQIPQNFDEILRIGFQQPRKTLLNNLKNSLTTDFKIMDKIKELDLNRNVRPHELTLDHWLNLANQLKYAKN